VWSEKIWFYKWLIDLRDAWDYSWTGAMGATYIEIISPAIKGIKKIKKEHGKSWWLGCEYDIETSSWAIYIVCNKEMLDWFSRLELPFIGEPAIIERKVEKERS